MTKSRRSSCPMGKAPLRRPAKARSTKCRPTRPFISSGNPHRLFHRLAPGRPTDDEVDEVLLDWESAIEKARKGEINEKQPVAALYLVRDLLGKG